METPNDEQIRGEDKKVSLTNLSPGGPRSNLRDEDTHSDHSKIEFFSDEIPGIAPRPRNEQDTNMISNSEVGLTALVPLASLTASALQAPPQSAREPRYKRQRLQANGKRPRKDIVAKRVVSLAELHRRRGLTLFQFFWEQGMTCVPPDDHPFWHNDKDDFEPYEDFWAPSRGPQWDDPMWHNDYDEETSESFFNLSPGGPKPCFWNEDGSFSERVFRMFFDSIPGVASSSKDAEYIAAITGVTSAGSQTASSYNAWPPLAVPAIRKKNQYASRRGNFKLLQNEGMPFPKLVNKKVPIEELHRRRSLSLLQFFQEMGMPSIPSIDDPFWSNEIHSYPGWYCNYGIGPQGNHLAWHNDYKKETGESFFNMHPREHSPDFNEDDCMDTDDGYHCISPPSRKTNKGKRQIEVVDKSASQA